MNVFLAQEIRLSTESPVINKFVIIQVGDTYQPIDPMEVTAEIGEQITVEWELLNTTEYSLVISNSTRRKLFTGSRLFYKHTFEINDLGTHTISLIAQNGNCEIFQDVIVEVLP